MLCQPLVDHLLDGPDDVLYLSIALQVAWGDVGVYDAHALAQACMQPSILGAIISVHILGLAPMCKHFPVEDLQVRGLEKISTNTNR